MEQRLKEKEKRDGLLGAKRAFKALGLTALLALLFATAFSLARVFAVLDGGP